MPITQQKTIIEEKQFVIFSIDSEEFGVDISEVREIIRVSSVTRIPNTQPHIKGVINLRGGIVVIMDLAMKLDLPKKEETKDTRIIVIESGNNTIGMVVDSAKEVLRMGSDRIKPAPPILVQKIKGEYLQGVGIIGDRLLILLDLAKVLDSKDIAQVDNLQNTVIPQSSQSKVNDKKEANSKKQEGGNEKEKGSDKKI